MSSLTDLAALIPPNIRFGTSTWTYPGWKGQIYKNEYASDRSFRADSLAEYSRWPLFRCVGIDSSFYAPPSEKTLLHYASLAPEGFLWISKVWEKITAPSHPNLPRWGKYAGTKNTDFLNAELFINEVLSRYSAPEIRAKTGPFVFQFPKLLPEFGTPAAFAAAIQKFLTKLPSNFQYAVEIRDFDILNEEYLAVLNSCGASHVFNHWTSMPSLREQMTRIADLGGLHANFFVSRLLTPLGVSYAQAVKAFAPYDSVKRPNPAMRRDTAALARRVCARGGSAFVIVNNRSEGNAPGTIEHIARALIESLKTPN